MVLSTHTVLCCDNEQQISLCIQSKAPWIRKIVQHKVIHMHLNSQTLSITLSTVYTFLVSSHMTAALET